MTDPYAGSLLKTNSNFTVNLNVRRDGAHHSPFALTDNTPRPMHFYILSNNEVYEVISRVLASEMVRTSYSFRFEKRESLALNEKTQNNALESNWGRYSPPFPHLHGFETMIVHSVKCFPYNPISTNFDNFFHIFYTVTTQTNAFSHRL